MKLVDIFFLIKVPRLFVFANSNIIVPPNSAIEPSMRLLRPSAPVEATNVFPMEDPIQDLQAEDNGLILNIKDEPQDEPLETNGPTEDDETFRCTDCDQTFQFRDEFNQHLAMHNGKQDDDNGRFFSNF
jgi:hypothetical protein